MTLKNLKMHSADLTQASIAKLKELFPSCVTEAEDLVTGEIKRVVNFDQLRQELSDHVVDGPQERFELNWPGKRKSMIAANAPINKTLRPVREDSVDFDTTENLFIEGDNLDALKLLQETYLGKVKMIYIDPPYNTGNDFIYKDDFKQSSSEYLHEAKQVDEAGNRLVTNPTTSGRFHSDWLSMIAPRLRLARNLLADDGVIFISVDDGEAANLKNLCDEVFGARNFVANCVWSRKRGKDNSAKFLSRNHEYLYAYARQIDSLKFGRLPLSPQTRKAYRNPDNDPRGDYRQLGIWARGTQGGSQYSFRSKTGEEFSERLWLVGLETMRQLDASDRLIFKGDKVYRKLFLSEHRGDIAETLWLDTSNAANAADELKRLFGAQIFDTVKPIPYIERMLKLGSPSSKQDIGRAHVKQDIILDFFAGSSTTAHAVMKLNAEDGGNRKFIMVQLPEEIEENHAAHKAGYTNIAELSKERIRRAGKQILESDVHENWNQDVGFRVLKIDSSNMKDVYYRPDELAQQDLVGLADNVKEDRSEEDLLFQVLLDVGVGLTLPVVRETIQEKEVFTVDKDVLIACFDKNVTEELVKELATRAPLRMVFRDAGFESDALKINVQQILQQLSPSTELKVI